MPKQTKPAAKPPADAQKPPDWLDSGTDGYELSWWPCQNSCPQLQGIELTRAEFIALKQHLAKLRGYAVPQEAAHA